MSALRLVDLHVERGGRSVLKSIDLTFGAGRLTAVIGPNGAGKSTLLECAAGLLMPSQGRVWLGDDPLASLRRRDLARRRAYLPQRATIEWPISVERVVGLGLTPSLPTWGNLPHSLKPAIDIALADGDLLHLRDRPATSLSGGELARVMLARAVVGDPELLIVDEPAAGLDPRHTIDAMRRLRARADAGRTVVLSLHEMDLALRFADDVVALKDGRLLWSGTVREAMTKTNLAELYDISVSIGMDAYGPSIRFFD